MSQNVPPRLGIPHIQSGYIYDTHVYLDSIYIDIEYMHGKHVIIYTTTILCCVIISNCVSYPISRLQITL